MPAFWEKVDKNANRIVAVFSAAVISYYIYTGFFGFGQRYSQLVPLLALGMVMAFIKKPLSAKAWTRPLDYLFALASVVILALMILQQSDPYIYLNPPDGIMLVLMWFLVLFVIEATRRVTGLIFTIIVVIAVLYAKYGDLLPVPFWHFPFDWERLIWVMTYGPHGIFGPILGVAAGVIVFFIIFAAFLNATGAGAGFVNVGISLFGRFRGGAAKAAIVSSALFGTVSGSGTANVLTSGPFTIPLMQKSGYKPVMAATVETLASAGGHIMPPIMFAVAFIMAEYIGVPYREIAIAAALPAVLYYISLFAVVDLEAAKSGLKGMSREDRPTVRSALLSAWRVGVVLAVLILLLFFLQWSPMRSVLYSLLSLLLISLLTRQGRAGLRRTWDTLVKSGSDMTLITLACATSGVLVAMLDITNLGVELSGILVSLSSGIPLVLLVMTMIANLVLGLGLSATATYLVQAVVMAPALVSIGFPLIATHLFILYFCSLSAITPPVAITAWAAAGLAGADPWKTGWRSMWLGLIAYVVPFFFMYAPSLLLKGDPITIITSSITAIIGTLGFAAMLQGYLIDSTNIIQRVLLGTGGLLMIYASWMTSVVGFALLVVVVLWQMAARKRTVSVLNKAMEREA